MAAIALVLIPCGSAAATPVPLAQTGSAGSDAGELNIPQDVAIDDAGNMHVADINNGRIAVFSGDGAFVRAFGWGVDTGAEQFEVCTAASACQAGIGGGGAGQLDAPRGVALDGAGNLYVAEQNSHRVSVFDTAGPSFLRAFGRGVDTGAAAFQVCTAASTCQAGTQGGGAGELGFPVGLTAAGGELFVSDQANQRISVFGGAGSSFSRAFGWGVDTGAAAFESCTTASACQAGLQGGGGGQLAFPQYLAIDESGSLHVAEQGNHRVSVFDPAVPSFLRAFGWGVDTGAAAFQVCTAASTCQAGVQGGGAGQFAFARGVAPDAAGGLYVSESNQRISRFDLAGPSFTHAFGWGVDTPADDSFELCTTASGCEAGVSGNGVGQLSGPLGLDLDCRGAIWVADGGNSRLQRFGEPGTPPCFSPPGPTGRRAAALRKCNKQYAKKLNRLRAKNQLTKRAARDLTKKRKRCKRKARKLPV